MNNATYTYLANSPLVSTVTFKQNTTPRMTTTKQYDLLNRLTSIVSSSSQLLSPISSAYSYNNANQRTRRSETDNSSWNYKYDSKGRRIGKKVWNNTAGTGSPVLEQKFVYDGWNLVAILNSAFSLQTSFTWGLDLSGSLQGAGGVGGLLAVKDATNGVHFCAYDGNGNVAALLNADGSGLTAQYEYGPFGEVLRSTGTMARTNQFRFSTKYQDDESDQLYYGYRFYNQSTGRWLNRDPIEERGDLNLHSFVKNDGIEDVDILGLRKTRFSLTEMQAMLNRSKEAFRHKLSTKCAWWKKSESWTTEDGRVQCCDWKSCFLQADLLALRFARYLEVNFTTEF